MKTIQIILLLLAVSRFSFAQELVTDYDGNVYHTVKIGNVYWLKENLKSRHYSDGTPIPDCFAYNYSDSLEQIYGLLYKINAAMRDSVGEKVQGCCPVGWYVPSRTIWDETIYQLGGSVYAGKKMKDTLCKAWENLNPIFKGDNSSGFSAWAGGSYWGTDYRFQGINETTMFISAAYMDIDGSTNGWYYTVGLENSSNDCSRSSDPRNPTYGKAFYIRCVKNNTVSINTVKNKSVQIYPSFVSEILTIEVPQTAKYQIYAISSQIVLSGSLTTGTNTVNCDALKSGLYIIKVESNNGVYSEKIIKK